MVWTQTTTPQTGWATPSGYYSTYDNDGDYDGTLLSSGHADADYDGGNYQPGSWTLSTPSSTGWREV